MALLTGCSGTSILNTLNNAGAYRGQQKLVEGMLARGYSAEFAERIYSQIKGFGDYGFPESHAASFALLTYFSAWLKCHHPAAFACGLLNSQPMGFYAPAQIINDVRRHGVAVRPADVRFSGWDCGLENTRDRGPGAGVLREQGLGTRDQGRPCMADVQCLLQARLVGLGVRSGWGCGWSRG